MIGFDPSMLVGLLVRDERDRRHFRRVGELPKPIFPLQLEAPTWPPDSDDNMGLESISEPDDLDLDDDEEGTEMQSEGDEDGDEVENEQVFETRSRSASNASNTGQESSRRGDRQSEDVDTREDPVGSMTPGPGSKERRRIGDFAFLAEEDEGFGEDDEEEEESDIEDDWVDPLLPTLTPPGPPPPPATASSQKPKKEQYYASSSSSLLSSSNWPPLAKGKGSSSSATAYQIECILFSDNDGRQQQQEGQETGSRACTFCSIACFSTAGTPFPVPAAPPDDNDDYSFTLNWETTSSSVGAPRYTRNGMTWNVSMKGSAQAQGQHQHQHRMHNARARDDGRTQSAGVNGILTDS
ncbi:hypothetical protein D9613_010223 [Agrocybe pediades]|uniref:Uncharacterized protein n=1 Tax=Agrocybe pediades TaxID=84607 RepID=A0A8H4QF10_9AGAR|nr:hypothetical protein D9613_010223 [Agrocybe pediades]